MSFFLESFIQKQASCSIFQREGRKVYVRERERERERKSERELDICTHTSLVHIHSLALEYQQHCLQLNQELDLRGKMRKNIHRREGRRNEREKRDRE